MTGHRARCCAVLCLAILVTALQTHPLMTHLASAIPGPPAPGDNFEYLYKIWWFKHAILDLGVSPFYNPTMFYPFGYNVALSETTLSSTIPALPSTLLWGEVVSYNLIVMLSFALSALGMYLLVVRLTGSTPAGVLSAAVFAFCPFRMAHLGAGHLPLMGTQWFPFFFLFMERLLVGRRMRDAGLAALFYSLAALSAWYYAYALALGGLLYVMGRLWPWRQRLREPGLVRGLIIFVAISAMLVGPFAYPVTGIWNEGSRPQSLRYLDEFSASPVDLIYPNVMQPIWGERLLALYAQVPEKMLYLGVVPLLLALYSLRRRTSRVQRAFAWLGAVFAVLAMGTSLHSPNGTLYFPVPAAVERLFTAGMGWLTTRLALNPIPSYSLRAASAVYVPLPTLLLYLFLPMFSAMRVWSRFGLLAVFGVAVLSGYGLRELLEKGRSSRLTAASKVAFLAGVLTISLADFAVFPYAMGWSNISARTVDAWLADQAGEFAVMELPLRAALSGRTLYSSRLHGKPIAFGYGTFFPRSFEEQRGILDHFPEERGVDLLRSWQVRYVLVHPDFYGEAWTAVERSLRASPSLRLHGVWQSSSPFEGDRVLRHLPGTESAFFDERVLVFEVL